MDINVVFRPSPSSELAKGRNDLLKTVCGIIGGGLTLRSIYVIGADFDSLVITEWDKFDSAGTRTRMSSMFRVQRGLITEWMDSVIDGPAPAAPNVDAAACQTVNTAIATLAPPPNGPPAAGPLFPAPAR